MHRIVSRMPNKKPEKFLTNNKGQALLEYLFSYGWVLIVVLVAITTLYHFGILNIRSVIPNNCIVPDGISCLDYKATSADIKVTLKNSLGQDLSSITVAATGCGTSGTVNRLTDGSQAQFTINCGSALSGSKYTGQLNVSYTKADTGVTHKSLGKITTIIE